jgi:tripartite-type tricarboxylate transporter receptor subunit TctC
MRQTLSRSTFVGGLGCAAAVSAGARAKAADFPDRPITIVIPFDPGGAVDQLARLIDKFTPTVFGHNFVFQYQPGAGGALGMTALAHAKPDGYTIGAYMTPNLIALPLMHAGAFSTADFSYLAQMIADPHALATLAGSSPYTSLKQFVAAAKASPGKLTVGLGDVYDGTRFALLNFIQKSGLNVTVIPLNGGNKQNAALLGKVIDAAMVNYSLVASEREKLNFLAVTTEQPFAGLPGVPTFRSQGFDVIGHDGRVYMTPKGVPPDVLAKLREGFKKIFDDPQFTSEAEKLSQPTSYLSGPAVEAAIRAEEPLVKKLLASATAQPSP